MLPLRDLVHGAVITPGEDNSKRLRGILIGRVFVCEKAAVSV
jgi:hypothetical protein